jgi:hypothetical protein
MNKNINNIKSFSNLNILSNSLTENQIDIDLKKGINGDKFILFYENNNFYIQISDIQCFSFSLRRAKNIFHTKNEYTIKQLLVKNIKNITIDKQNKNLVFLNIIYTYKLNEFPINISHKIKLKELDDYFIVSNQDDKDTLIKKQFEKINILLNKISEYQTKYKEPNTDEELIMIY